MYLNLGMFDLINHNVTVSVFYVHDYYIHVLILCMV